MKKSRNLQSSSPLKTLTLLFITFCGLVSIIKAEKEKELKCVCDESCEHLRAKDCPFGLTFDMCRCCLVCARREGEPCGGALGNCAIGLHCIKDQNDTKDEGRCSRDEDCGKVVDQYGCLIGPEGNCICSSRTVCPGEEMFLFDTEESCRSRMAFLIAKKDLEPATSPLPATDDCAKVLCPEVESCPTDSYRLPTAVLDTNHHQTSNSDKDSGGCCPVFQKCQCIPGLHCSPPECPRGYVSKVVVNTTGEPGRCCPKFECSISSPGDEDNGVLLHKCNYSGREYHSGETWSHHQDCTECICHNGVVSCKPLKCDLPAECRLAQTTSQSCCPVCVGCLTSYGAVYNNSELWEEDPCTTCTCNEGRIQCHAAMCQTTCSNPNHIPGECCPRCDNGASSDKEQSCPFLDCHRRDCPNGFRLDKSGCQTCKCIKCRSLTACRKKCPYGYQTDDKQCPTCNCRVSEELNNLLLPHPQEKEKEEKKDATTNSWKQIGHTHCLHTSDGIFRVEGDEWSDNCRRCICKNGLEMCSLITCNPPKCEHPIFFTGDCCPKCPDEEIEISSNFNLSVCQSSDGTERLEGEMWSLSSCLTCTCHSGQVLCVAPECPPSPCPNSFIQSPQDCCLSCPSPKVGDSFTNESSHSKKSICLSDDSAKSYSDGEMWKVGACQSCICEGGQIRCFSAGKCPPLYCDRPVLAKNQCCPICLGQRRQMNGTAELPGSKDILVTRRDEEDTKDRGIEPHCAIMIATLMCLTLVLTLIVVRQCFCRRSSSRLIKKVPPSFHSSNSSNTHETPPITDCCYKCDYNKYSSCAQLSEQKPLFKPSNDSSSGNNSDKV